MLLLYFFMWALAVYLLGTNINSYNKNETVSNRRKMKPLLKEEWRWNSWALMGVMNWINALTGKHHFVSGKGVWGCMQLGKNSLWHTSQCVYRGETHTPLWRYYCRIHPLRWTRGQGWQCCLIYGNRTKWKKKSDRIYLNLSVGLWRVSVTKMYQLKSRTLSPKSWPVPTLISTLFMSR